MRGEQATEVILYRIRGGGHTWPGGAQYLPASIVGPVCRDIDATDVIWKFFKAHSRR
jgi:polyhydroxybutyrate depolymerase